MSDLVDFIYQDLLYGLNELTAFQPQTIEDLYDAYFFWTLFFVNSVDLFISSKMPPA